MICCSRPVQHGTVLTAVKAEPSGWPTASLDPGSGRRRSTRTRSRPTEITQQDPPIQVSTVSGDCRNCETRAIVWVPKTLSRPPTSTFTASRRRDYSPQALAA
jgi:hypothetical protein